MGSVFIFSSFQTFVAAMAKFWYLCAELKFVVFLGFAQSLDFPFSMLLACSSLGGQDPEFPVFLFSWLSPAFPFSGVQIWSSRVSVFAARGGVQAPSLGFWASATLDTATFGAHQMSSWVGFCSRFWPIYELLSTMGVNYLLM